MLASVRAATFDADASSYNEDDLELQEEFDEETRIEMEFEKEERYARFKCAARHSARLG